ncbi:protein ENHANCED DISEASE RESISTANCE 4-like [Mercurialis annua]|uniref:protein ENHANCED DISEASE RESISTANCE 4-like n=1 Tax=Mercurialis annua TaxID=3986 RepID=UPI002160E1C1|nr:protein ENHANCED DISEASE RESISTANCE 4-like [Mercurialis annua]
MAEEGPSKVRLVRCPKCENLLPELPNYSVYECGGCGTLLRAKKKMDVNGEVFEKLETLSEREDGGSELDFAFEKIEREKRDGGFLDKGKDRVFRERNFNSGLNRKETSIHSSNNRILNEQFGGYNDRYKEMDMIRSESVISSRGNDMGKVLPQFRGSVGLSRPRAFDRDGVGEPHRNPGNDRSRVLHFDSYLDEGPSNYNYMKSSAYGHGQLLKDFDDLDGASRFAQLEQDRVELLRKLDQLKEQISRSGSVAENRRDTAQVGVKMSQDDVYNNDRVPYDVSMKPLGSNEHVSRPNYFKQNGYERVVGTSSRDKEMQNFYSLPKHNANQFPVYRYPSQPHGHYSSQPPHDYNMERHLNFDQEYRASYPHRTLYHEPGCACYQCYNKKWHVPSQVPATISQNNRFLEEPVNFNFGNHVNPMRFGIQNGNRPGLHSRDPKLHATRDMDSDMDDIRKNRPRRMTVVHGNRRICHPIAGGAPFIACCSCFELLKLPRKLNARAKNPQKLQCGACSIVFLIEICNKKLIISIPVEDKQKLAAEEVLLSPERANHSVEFNNRDYDFQSVDLRGNLLPEDPSLNSNYATTRHGLTSLSSSSSEEGKIFDSMIVQRDESVFTELPTKDTKSPTVPNFSSPKNSDGVPSNRKIKRNEEGNKSNRADKQKFTLDPSTPQKSVSDISSETEVEVSVKEFPNTTTSQDSWEVSKEHNQPRTNKGSESFLAGLLKKSFKDFSRSNQLSEDEKAYVFVNGIHIPDSMVKKAEKLAGPIHPGDYWYDSQAGFWGVRGQSCMGIIPPCIKEFNYPMSENCSSGDTRIFVNGRELPQNDLDLLASRGLPITKYKFYIVEISGRVVEKDSGKELKSLGKLAPTVEKMQRGFGMKVPRKLQ